MLTSAMRNDTSCPDLAISESFIVWQKYRLQTMPGANACTF